MKKSASVRGTILILEPYVPKVLAGKPNLLQVGIPLTGNSAPLRYYSDRHIRSAFPAISDERPKGNDKIGSAHRSNGL
jgi:hypothetical protein